MKLANLLRDATNHPLLPLSRIDNLSFEKIKKRKYVNSFDILAFLFDFFLINI